jgi:hypothetical protein
VLRVNNYFGKRKKVIASVLTQDKGYRGWELDEGFGNTLTQIRGYPDNEHEFAGQTGISF